MNIEPLVIILLAMLAAFGAFCAVMFGIAIVNHPVPTLAILAVFGIPTVLTWISNRNVQRHNARILKMRKGQK